MPKKKGLTLTPGLQDLVTEVNARHARAQESAVEADAEGGVPLLGKIFNEGSDFVADRVGDVVQGGAYVLNTMDLSRKWVAQPVLGAMTATVAGQWGEVESYSDLRRIWDESKVPGPVKFVSEMAFDPLLWTGWGWAQTSSVKFAKALTPLVLGGKGIGVAGRLAAPATALPQMVGRSYKIGKADFAFSGRSRKAITALSKGKLKNQREINALVKESVKLGYVPKNPDAIRQATEMIREGSGSFGRMLNPGWMARLAEPLRMNRLLSPVDVLFENMWMVPFGAAAPLLVPTAKVGGRLAVKAIDAAGKTLPIKSALWLGARVGPELGNVRLGHGEVVSVVAYIRL
ncbi:hypothetical protein LCGC14_1526410 [marine sediment metagenome]|uniref:Uncharacterized protein n=1 Tax=marine sediment metagenome TaxID=412755 RepID=A0A0F9IXG6_9ZZZZ